MFTTYVLENTCGKRYTVQTESLSERLLMHNDASPEKAKFHRSTYNKGPWKIIFTKSFETRIEAMEFEKYLKTGVGREWLKGVTEKG